MIAPEFWFSFNSHINPKGLNIYQISGRPEVVTVFSSLPPCVSHSDAMQCCGGGSGLSWPRPH